MGALTTREAARVGARIGIIVIGGIVTGLELVLLILGLLLRNIGDAPESVASVVWLAVGGSLIGLAAGAVLGGLAGDVVGLVVGATRRHRPPNCFVLAALLALSTAAAAQSRPSPSSIIRLPPHAFPALPRAVATVLDSRRCHIPQTAGAATPENVVRGSFTAAQATEWAVLCSIADTGRILILQRTVRGDVRVVDSLARGSDVACMQGTGDGRWAYSCLLQLRPQHMIRGWARLVHGRIDHDAIERVFVGKAAVAYYFANGRWYRMVTAD